MPAKGLREGFKGSGAGKQQARTPLKTDGWGMWLRELLPVAWERLAGGFEALEGAQTVGSNATMAGACGCESCCQLPAKGLRDSFKGSGAGKPQARRPLKKQMAGACGCESCCQLPAKGLRGGF